MQPTPKVSLQYVILLMDKLMGIHVGQIISALVEDGVAYANIDAGTTLTLQVPYDGDSPSHILVSLRSQ